MRGIFWPAEVLLASQECIRSKLLASVSQGTRPAPVVKTNQLMLLRELIRISCDNRTQHIEALYGKM